MWRRSLFLLSLLLSAMVVWSGHGLAWSAVAHSIALEKAIEVLPRPLKGFYEKRESYVLGHLEDATIGSPRTTFEVDSLEPFPFEDLPLDRESAIEKYGEEKVGEIGDLPWKLIEGYQKLVQAFQQKDLEAIDAVSAELVLYLNDLHQPLNVSKLGDGVIVGQEGFRERLDSRLLETYGSELEVKAATAIYLDRPDQYLISVLVRSYVWVDNLLLVDYFSRLGVSSYDRFYYEGLWLRAEDIVNERISDSAKDIASYWYTAWSKAGKPELPNEQGAQ